SWRVTMPTASWLRGRKTRPVRRPWRRLWCERLEDRTVPVSRLDYSLPLPSGISPNSITAGPPGDQHVWFTEASDNMIGRIDVSSPGNPTFDPAQDTIPSGGQYSPHVVAQPANIT